MEVSKNYKQQYVGWFPQLLLVEMVYVIGKWIM